MICEFNVTTHGFNARADRRDQEIDKASKFSLRSGGAKNYDGLAR
jgi:hypothetical protein